MSGVEEIIPEAWADACDSRGDLFSATIIRRLIAERDEALAATTDLAEQAEPTLLELRYAELSIDVLRDFLRADRLERDEALGEATRLADELEEAIENPEPQPTAAGAALTWLLGWAT